MSSISFATPCVNYSPVRVFSQTPVCTASPTKYKPQETETKQKPKKCTSTLVKPNLPANPPVVLPASKDLLQAVAESAAETAEEVQSQYARLLRNLRESHGMSVKVKTRPHVLVLGSGWAAHSFIKAIGADLYDVSVVSPRNYYFFTPLLPATSVGTVEFRSVVEPIRHANQFINYYEAECTNIDFQKGQIECRPTEDSPLPYEDMRRPSSHVNGNGYGEAEAVESTACMLARRSFRINFDYLIVAVGETIGTFGVPGVREHAHFLKEMSDSLGLRHSILRAFETASLPYLPEEERENMLHFVVVGGGPTGCEFAGELSDFVSEDLHTKYPSVAPLVKVTLLQSRGTILPQFEKNLQERALANFEKQGVEVVVNARVVNVSSTHVELKDGRSIPYGVLVWAAGNSPRSITSSLISSINENHEKNMVSITEDEEPPQPYAKKLTVDPWLRVKGAQNVFALGDCSLVEKSPFPATAQVAGQQGTYLARALRKWAREDEDRDRMWDTALRPFRFLNLGQMSYIGNDKAIMQMDTHCPNMQTVSLSGFVSYLLWAGIYAAKQVVARNRILVLFDWFKTRVFGRDTSQF